MVPLRAPDVAQIVVARAEIAQHAIAVDRREPGLGEARAVHRHGQHGKSVEGGDADAVQDRQRDEPGQGERGPAAGALAHGRGEIGKLRRDQDETVERRAVRASREAQREAAARGEAQKGPRLSRRARAERFHEVHHVVVELADIVDVAAAPRAVMAAHGERIDGGAARRDGLGDEVHVRRGAGRAMDQDDDPFGIARIGAIGERGAVARRVVPFRRQAGEVQAGERLRHACHRGRGLRRAEGDHGGQRGGGGEDDQHEQGCRGSHCAATAMRRRKMLVTCTRIARYWMANSTQGAATGTVPRNQAQARGLMVRPT